MANDAFVAFWCGVGVGMVVGVFTLAVILVVRTNEFRRQEETDDEQGQ